MSRETLLEMLRCCEAWEPDVCIMGNVRCADAAQALRAALAEANPMQCEHCGIQFADKQPGSLCPNCYREVTKAESAGAEPVAWRVQRTDKAYELFFNKHIAERAAACYVKKPEVEPLYTHPPAREAEPVDEEVIGEHSGASDRREWWTGGTWLYPGDTVVVRRAAAMQEKP